MTTDTFVEAILDEYDNSTGRHLKAGERAASREFIVADVPHDDLGREVSAKLAALIIHRSLQRLTDEKDDDWGQARQFKDIYDCRVCANAVAQVSVKGILEPVSKDEFGMTRILSDEELKKAVLRVFDGSKRVTNLLGF